MHANEVLLTGLRVLGGLALFLFAIALMTKSLQAAGGHALRGWVRRATRGRWTGGLLGTALGFLLHSSATTVLLVGFLHAGLLTLPQAIGPIAGANLGTTLSMQLISFKLGDYFFVPILAGVALTLAARRRAWDETGRALVGFGLLFLSMQMMSGAVAPHRDALSPWLAFPREAGLAGQVSALLISAAVTAVLQSSGATIGILFALIGAGVFPSIEPILPLVLGAHIGTCSTALAGAMGTSIEGRRGAVAHLLFNVIGAMAALAATPWVVPLIEASSSDLVRQTANLHTAVMLGTLLLVLPLRTPFVWAVRAVTRSAQPAPAASALDDDALLKPERALYLSVRELQRVAAMCAHTFRLNAEIMFRLDRATLRTIRHNEEAVDEIQRALKRYLQELTSRYLSRRQSIMLQHLNRCMIDIERIGDHNENIADLTEQRLAARTAPFPSEAQQALFSLFESADRVLHLVIASLDPDQADFQATAHAILQARDGYVDRSLNAKALFADKIIQHAWPPMVGMYLSEYVTEFDRIVRHSKMIALAESHPYFWIKRQKLDRIAPEMPVRAQGEKEPTDFLDKLQQEGFV
jgi:phosphate:Na+ symporter